MIQLDARGMSCPQPVLVVKKAIGGGTPDVEVLVDNATAKNNIFRFLQSAGYQNITCDASGEDLLIKGKR